MSLISGYIGVNITLLLFKEELLGKSNIIIAELYEFLVISVYKMNGNL